MLFKVILSVIHGEFINIPQISPFKTLLSAKIIIQMNNMSMGGPSSARSFGRDARQEKWRHDALVFLTFGPSTERSPK